MNHSSVLVACISASVFFNSDALSSEPPPKPAKTRLVARPLPGGVGGARDTEAHVFQRPVTEANPVSGGASGQTDDKARIGAIRRGAGDGQLGRGAPSSAPVIEAAEEKKSPGSDGKGSLPLRPGQIRVVPKAEMKTDAVVEIAAHQTP